MSIVPVLSQNKSVKHHFQQLKILIVHGLYILQTILYVKIKLGSNHEYDTRQRNCLVPTAIRSHTLDLLKSQLQEQGLYIIYLWNFKILITLTYLKIN